MPMVCPFLRDSTSLVHNHHFPRTHLFNFYEHEDYQVLVAQQQEHLRNITRLESKQSMLLTKISNLEFAQDLVMRKKWELTSVTKKTTKVLTDVTGDCDECWFYKFDSCEDEIKDLRISKCLEICALQSEIDDIKTVQTALREKQNVCRDRLIKEHEESTCDTTTNQGATSCSPC